MNSFIKEVYNMDYLNMMAEILNVSPIDVAMHERINELEIDVKKISYSDFEVLYEMYYDEISSKTEREALKRYYRDVNNIKTFNLEKKQKERAEKPYYNKHERW